MRIAYLVNQYPKISHSFIRREIAELEAQGFEVERISVRRTRERLVDPADQAESERTRVLLDLGPLGLLRASAGMAIRRPLGLLRALRATIRQGWHSGKGLFYHGIYLAEACALARWLEACGAEHLHAHFSTNPATVALFCRELGGPSFSFTFHGPEIFDHPKFAALREKIARARFCVAISHHGQSQLMRWSDPADWPRIHLVHCGVDRAYLEATPAPPPERPRLVCVARLSPEKGHLVLLEAAARLLREGVDFEIALVGDGDFRSTLEARASALGLSGRILFLGWQDGLGVRREIEASRAMVLPSFDEGLPVVFMESLALGRPVISTYIAGIPELVRPGECGWLVPAGAVDALVEALRAVLDASPEELARAGARGRSAVLASHDCSCEAARLAELFRAHG